MCIFNISLDDVLVANARQVFSSNEELTRWLQQQVEQTLIEYTKDFARQQKLSMIRKAIDEMRQQSEQNGNAEMTLDEIDQEIKISRQERNLKNKVIQ